MDTISLTAKEAIKYVSEYYGIPTKYAIAKALSDDKLNVQPTQISNYLKGTRMSTKVAERFRETFDIIITDAYIVNKGWLDNEDIT